jgi:hypothetical protein
MNRLLLVQPNADLRMSIRTLRLMKSVSVRGTIVAQSDFAEGKLFVIEEFSTGLFTDKTNKLSW